jgi:hypothetical protein
VYLPSSVLKQDAITSRVLQWITKLPIKLQFTMR